MTAEERKEIIEQIASKFTELPPDMKDKIAWYIMGKEEERAKWEKRTA